MLPRPLDIKDAAPIRVNDGSGVRLTSPGGHLESIDDELGSDVIGDRPAHDAAAEDVEDRTAVDLAVPRRMFGHVRAPQLVGRLGDELPLDQVLVDGGSGPVAALPAVADALETGGAHQSGDPLLADPVSSAELEFGVDPWRPIGGPGGGVDVSDLVEEEGVGPVPVRRRPRQPVVVAGAGDLENPAGHRDVDAVTAQLVDQPEHYFGRTFSRAK